MKRIKGMAKKIRASARGEACTLLVHGVHKQTPDNDTVVLCHSPFAQSGVGAKADELDSCYGCDACHSWLDSRTHAHEPRRIKETVFKVAKLVTHCRLEEKFDMTLDKIAVKL